MYEKTVAEVRTAVVVLGGGPAGAAAALALARAGMEVVLLQRPGAGTPDRGETLPPEIRLPLTELGLWMRFNENGPLLSPGTVSAWGGPEPAEVDFLFNPTGSGWHVDRGRFDTMLLQGATEAGVTVRRDTLLTRVVPASSGGWKLEGVVGAQRVEVRADFLIDATGRGASPARQLGGHRVVYDRLVGLLGTATVGSESTLTERRALVEAVEDGWWYSAPLPGGRRTAVAFLTDADLFTPGRAGLEEAWWARLRRAPLTSERLNAGGNVHGLRVVAANTSRAEQFAGPGWLAAGDAAAALDPLCGQGVYQALESGLLAAMAAAGSLRGDGGALQRYAHLAEEGFLTYLKQRSECYGSEGRWPASPFWQRRQATSTRDRVGF